MEIRKLFQVLVVGGAILSGNAVLAQEETQSLTSENDSRQLPESFVDETQLKPIFCTRPEACEVSPEGRKVVKAGFICCWGTSCE